MLSCRGLLTSFLSTVQYSHSRMHSAQQGEPSEPMLCTNVGLLPCNNSSSFWILMMPHLWDLDHQKWQKNDVFCHPFPPKCVSQWERTTQRGDRSWAKNTNFNHKIHRQEGKVEIDMSRNCCLTSAPWWVKILVLMVHSSEHCECVNDCTALYRETIKIKLHQ